jgi:hypothetical protein
MVENVKTPSSAPIGRRGLNRRELLGAGIAGVTIAGFPYVSRGLAAQTLKFWQFYAPGGGVPSQDNWFEGVVKAWNDNHEVKVELVYVPNSAYMDGTKLPTAFASGASRSLHHQPRRLPSLLQRWRASRSDALHGAKRARRLSPECHREPHG